MTNAPEVLRLDHRPTLEEAQGAVGGYVELVELEGGGRQLIVNEEGLLLNLPVNPEATLLAGVLIVGPALLLEGDNRWLPDEEDEEEELEEDEEEDNEEWDGPRYGPKGYTITPEIDAIVGRDPSRPVPDCERFDLTAERLLKLRDALPTGQLRDRQNAGPTFAQMCELAVSHPDLRFECYRIHYAREDERITVEGFYGHWDDVQATRPKLEEWGCWPPDEWTGSRAWWD